MRKLAVLVGVVTLLLSSAAFAKPLPYNLSRTVWSGDISCLDPSGTRQTFPIVITFGTQSPTSKKMNYFISGTIASGSAIPLPDGFPTAFSAMMGPFVSGLMQFTAIDSVIFADAYGAAAANLRIRGSITGGNMAGNSFWGLVERVQ